LTFTWRKNAKKPWSKEDYNSTKTSEFHFQKPG